MNYLHRFRVKPGMTVFLFGLLLCIPIVWNFLQPHFFHLQDFTHVARLAELERGLQDGQLPLRWSQNLGFGYGMPQFSFYGPLFYFEAFFFRLLQVNFIWSIKLAVVLQVIVTYFALYKLGELLWGKWAGFLTGIAGIYAPYRLVDLYVRGAFAELSGMTFATLVFYAIASWAKKPSWRKAIFVILGSSGLLLSHTLMALICGPFVVAWLGFWIVYEKRMVTHWKQVVMIGVLSLGLPAFFVFPALLENGYTQVNKLVTGFSTYSQHFLYLRQLWNSPWGYGGSVWGINDGMTFELGKFQIILLVIGLLLFIRQIRKSDKVVWFLYVGLGLALFLTVLKSKFVWDVLPFMAYLQFPWRYLSIAVLFVGLLVGSFVRWLPKRWMGVITVSFGLMIVLTQVGHARPEKFLDNDQLLYYSDTATIQTQMSGIIPDFLPNAAKPQNLPIGIAPNQRFSFSPDIKTTTEVNRSHEFLLSIPASQPATFTARIFDFPGWTLYLNGQILSHDTTKDGLIEARMPKTDQDGFLSGRFEETPIRMASDIVSVISIFIVIGLWTL